MSFFRPRSVATNKTVYFDNRLYSFLRLPMRTGNLYVEKNETVARDLAVGGNLTIANDLIVGGNLAVQKSQTIGIDLTVGRNQTVTNDLAVGRNLAVENDVTIGDDLAVGDNLAVQNNVTIGNDLAVDRDQTIGRDLAVARNLVAEGDVTATNVHANVGNFYLDGYLLIPYGTIIQSAAVVVPTGWLICDGASKVKATYLNLFNAIGYTYGGSGLNFNLPDLRGRVAVGSGTGAGLTSRALAFSSGVETHVLNESEIPSHTHTHTSNPTGNYGLILFNGIDTQNSDVNDTSGEPNLYAEKGTLIIENTGGGLPHNNMQPFLVLNYLIKY
jgi:microcystin-dependent protein